ncbi:MAG: hypothetical protein KBS84_09570 [Treponema sp.]|nr:hypothetical protein [Candidatus Treponema scatequi]
MTDIKLDEIPQLIESKKISFNQACILVYKKIYFEPIMFDIVDLDEDERSDFLLFFLQKKIPTLLKNFNPEITSFGSYVYTVLKLTKIDYRQKLVKQNNMTRTYIQESIIDYDDLLSRTQKAFFNLADKTEGYVPQTEEEKIPSLVYKKFFRPESHRLCVAESRKRKLKRGVLILALKSAWYLNDDEIHKVSNYCKISSDILSSTVCSLKANLINKALIREEIQNNRARAYCLINNYQLQMQNYGTCEGLPKFKRLEERMEFQKRSFTSKTKVLQSGRYKIAPTNAEIAKVLGIKTSIIANVLTRFRKLTPELFNDEK